MMYKALSKKLNKHLSIKLIFLGILSIGIILGLFWYINTYSEKSKATDKKNLTVTLNAPSSIKNGDHFNLSLQAIDPEYNIIAVELFLEHNPSLLRYSSFDLPQYDFFNEIITNDIKDGANNNKIVHLVLLNNKIESPNQEGPVLLNYGFHAIATGNTTFTLLASGNYTSKVYGMHKTTNEPMEFIINPNIITKDITITPSEFGDFTISLEAYFSNPTHTTFSLKTIVKNIGNGALGGSEISFYLDQPLPITINTPKYYHTRHTTLGPGMEIPFESTNRPITAKNHTLCAVVDIANEQPESNEDNNIACVDLLIPTITPTPTRTNTPTPTRTPTPTPTINQRPTISSVKLFNSNGNEITNTTSIPVNSLVKIVVRATDPENITSLTGQIDFISKPAQCNDPVGAGLVRDSSTQNEVVFSYSARPSCIGAYRFKAGISDHINPMIFSNEMSFSTVSLPTPTNTPIPPTATRTPTPIDTCPNFAGGNANCDANGKVNLADFACWRYDFVHGQTATNCRKADFNNDGKVTLYDFAIWRSSFVSGNNGTPWPTDTPLPPPP